MPGLVGKVFGFVWVNLQVEEVIFAFCPRKGIAKLVDHPDVAIIALIEVLCVEHVFPSLRTNVEGIDIALGTAWDGRIALVVRRSMSIHRAIQGIMRAVRPAFDKRSQRLAGNAGRRRQVRIVEDRRVQVDRII